HAHSFPTRRSSDLCFYEHSVHRFGFRFGGASSFNVLSGQCLPSTGFSLSITGGNLPREPAPRQFNDAGHLLLQRQGRRIEQNRVRSRLEGGDRPVGICRIPGRQGLTDRKSTRLNSSHVSISYAVFCLKKKT